jgi:hypothetical protein
MKLRLAAPTLAGIAAATAADAEVDSAMRKCRPSRWLTARCPNPPLERYSVPPANISDRPTVVFPVSASKSWPPSSMK